MIRDTYVELITEQIIKDILTEGNSPTSAEILQQFTSFTEENDISRPLFVANNYHVDFGEASSASKFNNTNNNIHRDLKVLYRHLIKVSESAMANFDRWRAESNILEGRLEDLQERITSLLLLSNDTAGFFNFMQDNFVDNNKIDLANSDTYINVQKGIVTIGTSVSGATRIDLSTLRDEDVQFTVLSRNNLVSTVSTQGSATRYAVSDVTNYWQERVYTNKPGPVSAEIKIDLLSSKQISRVDIDLHMANQNSTVQLTPLYSTDNYSWTQLPVTDFTRSVIDKTTFQFSPVTARYIKFIMTKAGFDQVHNELYAYEFGVDEVSLYKEGFSPNTESTFTSKPLSVTDVDGNIEEFSRIVLEVCEDVPEDTSVDYYISASNDPSAPLTGFTAIDPLNRTNSTNPTVLDFGELDTVTVDNISISYDPTGASTSFINPSKSFQLITSTSGADAVTASGDASSTRYYFFNDNDRILSHQVGSGVRIAQGTLEVWRNVSIKGDEYKVRGYTNGWGFEDPYYKTTVYVDNAAGHSVDWGGKTVIIDGQKRTGKLLIGKGRHTVWVHKDNWKLVDDSSVSDLADLKVADTLYPYNHRYLVEGFNYSSVYPTTEEKVYRGFDIIAEHFMKQVSIFDIINNVTADDYSKFALDKDVEDSSRDLDGSSASDTGETSVFVLKVDGSNPDFTNERFTLRFKSANSLFKYLRFKAVMKTTDNNKTPFLSSYRVKISS